MASIWAATKLAGRAVKTATKAATKTAGKAIGYKTPKAPKSAPSPIYRPTTAPKASPRTPRIQAIEMKPMGMSKPPPKPPRASTNSFTTTAEIHQPPGKLPRTNPHSAAFTPPGQTNPYPKKGPTGHQREAWIREPWSSPAGEPFKTPADKLLEERLASRASQYNPFDDISKIGSRRNSTASVLSGNSSTGLISGTQKTVKRPKTMKSMMHKVKKETSKKMDSLFGKRSQKYEVMQEDIINKKLKDKDRGSSGFGKFFKKKNTIGNKFKNDGSALDSASTVVKGASLGARALGVGKKVASTVGTGLAQALPYAAITASARGSGGDVINNINYPDYPDYPDIPVQPIYPPKEEERDQRDRDFIYG